MQKQLTSRPHYHLAATVLATGVVVTAGWMALASSSIAADAAVASTTASTASSATNPADRSAPMVRYRTQQVGEVEVFYREAGPQDAPVLLLLHGYPSSSHMYRDLIPLMATKYRVIAPDLPGFGSTKAPPRGEYDYNFANLADTIEGFTEAMNLDRYAIYLFDYGAPTGFRLAVKHPERVTAMITQNGNAYDEGLTAGWDPVRAYWNDPTPENRNALLSLQTPETTRWQYHTGVPDELADRIGPDPIAHDQAILDRTTEIQLDLVGDYKTNVARYAEWQAYFREHQPPMLAVWGKGDPFFGPDGAKAFKRDLPEAEIHLLDTGHFALETHADEIAALMHDFLGRHLK